jgi:hypothetical protein
MAAAGLNFDDVTPDQINALMAGLPPPTAEERALARHVHNMFKNLQEKEISMNMRLAGKTREEAIALANNFDGYPLDEDDPQNKRDFLAMHHAYDQLMQQMFNNPIHRIIRQREDKIFGIPGIGVKLDETIQSKVYRTLDDYYSRQNAGKRRRNKSKKSKRKSRKTRRRKH